MQIRPFLLLVTLGLTVFSPSHAQTGQEIELPVTANLGLGFGQLHSHIDLTASDQRIFSFQPELSGSVSRETLTKYKDKLPEEVPQWLTKADISYAPYVLPTLYFTPPNDRGESVYGASIGPGLGVNVGADYVSVGVGLGLMATYLYMESDRFVDNHYLTLGARAEWNIKLMPMRYVHLEVGQKYMQHIERELSNDEFIGRFREDYVMLHVRFPFTTNVKL
jgi:hypothetical protein